MSDQNEPNATPNKPANPPADSSAKTKATPKKPTAYIAVHEPTAEKKRVHPRFAKGKYQSIRLVSMYLILIGFLIMPWLRWDNHQAILFNVMDVKFYVFGATFMPQDFYFFAFVFMIAAYLLFVVTVYAGRVWCGYACPQTIYVHLYQHVEKWVLGERNKRIKFDKEPMSAGKLGKLLLIHLIWGVMSAITALTFIALVVGTDYLFFNGHMPFFMGWGKYTWVFFLLITAVTHINAGYMREHMCVHICPYGRFQSVMFDKDTLVVSYDFERGEPRGARKKGAERPDLGDCVDCTMCVQVCPTGIDIRDGLQVECIQCAACIDACNEIMDKVGKPRGLILYTTERQQVEKQKTKIIGWRIFAYVGLLTAVTVAAAMVLMGRKPIELDIRHDRGHLSTINREGQIQNSYVLKIVNKTDEKQTYMVKLEPVDGIELRSRIKELPLPANETYDLPISLLADATKVAKGRTPVIITVYTKDGKYSVSQNDFFIVE
ncbi:MAG: cytochrome c oxidase accessory protein CcoG [Moraxella sp.]|nr:cytochrome c oxidase accessory protein CcoG [Moraxella sp.]